MTFPNSSLSPNVCDGHAIAQEIFNSLKKQVAALDLPPELSVILVGSNPASKSYIRLKTRKAKTVGVNVILIQLPEDAQEEEILEAIDAEVEKRRSIIVQLPLPDRINSQRILNNIPHNLDVDILSDAAKGLFARGELEIEQPVVGSMKAILENDGIAVEGRNVVVIGNGSLVGKPAAAWFRLCGAHVNVADHETNDLSVLTKQADIIVCGAGVPGLITPEIIKCGVVILDAGTSEDSGKLRGDADPSCADKASLFTPVPGGIGPITVAVLLRNVVVSR